MRNPSIDTLLEIIDSKYSLALTVAKRAQSIDRGSVILITKAKSKKPIGIALEEIIADKLKKTQVITQADVEVTDK